MTQGPPNPKNEFAAAPRPISGKAYWQELWLKVRIAVLVAVLVTLGIASLLLYTADRRSTRQSNHLVTPEQVEALRLRSMQLEASFEKIRQERFELKEADIALLEEALRIQEEYIDARQAVGTDNARQQSLRRRLHLIRAENLRHDSNQAEESALALAKTDEAAAIPLLRRAVECELEIETKWGFSGLAEPGRRARLETRLRRLESAPLWLKGRFLEAEGEKLFSQGRFSEAAAKFDQALVCETDFLALYRDVRDTEFGRSDKLAERRETAMSGESWNAVRAHRALAESAEKSGDWPAATQSWQAAVEAFAKLLTDYPKSSFADRTQEATIATRLNFARFHDDVASLRRQAEALRVALRARQVDEAVRLADSLVGEARRLAEANTGAFLEGDDERRELEYLAANTAVIRSVLPVIDQKLRPLPARTVRIFSTEIPQGLYASITGANPSSTRREANPVESVTYAEAEAFAIRLGWILGAKARLPSIAEFTDAVGDLTKPDQAWTSENTDGISVHIVGSSAPNALGIHDLVGNVEEWALAGSEEPRAPVLGGSITTPLGKVLPSRAVFKREKSRTLGFRIVIE
jgi:tetratricopeptide (TPR) repeat protein